MTATLMMATYNRVDLTKQTIECLAKHTKYYPVNLVIVDNGSTDDTGAYLSSLDGSPFMRMEIIFNTENKGIAVARNQGLYAANSLGTEWYCTIDNDVWVPENWLTQCIDILKANPKYGMIGVNMEGRKYATVASNGFVFQHKPQGNLGTACMVFPKSLHKMIGYFNTEYEKYAHEDADYGMRARALGLQLGYINDMGKHIGEGENDQGEYREFKNKHHKENLPLFHENARLYMSKKKSLYIPYKE